MNLKRFLHSSACHTFRPTSLQYVKQHFCLSVYCCWRCTIRKDVQLGVFYYLISKTCHSGSKESISVMHRRNISSYEFLENLEEIFTWTSRVPAFLYNYTTSIISSRSSSNSEATASEKIFNKCVFGTAFKLMSLVVLLICDGCGWRIWTEINKVNYW